MQVHSSVRIGTAGAISSAKTMSHSRRRSALTSSGSLHAAKIDSRSGTCGIARGGCVEIDWGSTRDDPIRVDTGERVVVLHVEPRLHRRRNPGCRVEIAGIAPEIGKLDQPLAVAFENRE